MDVILHKDTSTNGRWGITIVGPQELLDEHGRTTWPKQGRLTKLGTVNGHETFRFMPDTTIEQWVLPADDCKVISGASIAVEMSLQSNSYGSVLLLSPQAVVEHIGYKGRSSSVVLYIGGQRQSCPPEVLLAAGLIEGEEEKELEPPPQIDSALAQALKNAGY